MQIPVKNKIPKIISGIVATISLIAIEWFILPPFWFWVSLEIVAAALVAIGCIGEWWLHHHPAGRKKKEKDEHHKLESRFIAMVSLGVTMELFALGHSIMEGKSLEKKAAEAQVQVKQLGVQIIDTSNTVAQANERIAVALANAAQANERAAKFDADRAMIEKEAEEIRGANFVLQTKLLQIETAIKWRTITPEQETNLIIRLKPFAMANFMFRYPIKITAVGDIEESRRYGRRISDVLSNCGFSVQFDEDINFGTSKTNGLVFAVPPHLIKPIPLQAIEVLAAFRMENIPVIDTTDDHVSEGGLQIWVLPKPE